MTAVPVSAQTTVIGTISVNAPSFIENYSVKVSKNFVSPDSTNFLKIYSYNWNSVVSSVSYDLTSLASEKSQVIGTQNYNFKIFTNEVDFDSLNSIILRDNKGNIIKKCTYDYRFSSDSAQTFVVQTNLVKYDLNYDGEVTSEDAHLAN